MTSFYAAQYDLEALINTHLFVICPNNSGSTFLKNALSTSKYTWNLVREGQHVVGFQGPRTSNISLHLLWTAKKEWLALFTDQNAYNWPKTRKAWYFQATSLNPKASIFVTKAPPFLLNVESIDQYFSNARFIFMTRNPYAVVEGICRGSNKHVIMGDPTLDVLQAAANHIINCFRFQKANIERFTRQCIFFTYEDMCDRPAEVEDKISQLVPQLNDLKLKQKLSVKRNYNEMLRNMNEQQISNLNIDDISKINTIFKKHIELLDYFKYPIIEQVL